MIMILLYQVLLRDENQYLGFCMKEEVNCKIEEFSLRCYIDVMMTPLIRQNETAFCSMLAYRSPCTARGAKKHKNNNHYMILSYRIIFPY